MNVIWRAVCFRYETIELLFSDDEWFVFVDAPDRETAQAKLQLLLPVILDISPHEVEHYYPRNEAELRRQAMCPDASPDLALLECGWENDQPQYLTGKEVLFWVSAPHLQQRLIAALNAVSQEAADGDDA
ncbi:hypothetical protein ID852_15645 [Xenorhabdus sp. 42]|uniref:hypothetical protein n=1 Tax=Xenorhabdus szentirmaii TaxID=290112 RepID=UPI0019A450A5|nr:MULTISPECIES: hypothetical protein [unclassified Xenorhabdus]MBD2780535.1 hypothetical protein [Xenorhabdus sp. 38]MBD2822092.1 hypothetical protein [Xenorhabdus sp. 42]